MRTHTRVCLEFECVCVCACARACACACACARARVFCCWCRHVVVFCLLWVRGVGCFAVWARTHAATAKTHQKHNNSNSYPHGRRQILSGVMCPLQFAYFQRSPPHHECRPTYLASNSGSSDLQGSDHGLKHCTLQALRVCSLRSSGEMFRCDCFS